MAEHKYIYPVRSCRTCGKEYRGKSSRWFCSGRCRRKTDHRFPKICSQCSVPFFAEKPTGRYCSQRCAKAALSITKAAERPAIDRFWAGIEKAANGCWIWQRARNGKGYAQFKIHSTVVKVARYAWTTFRGPIPKGLHVLHDCPGGDNPACVNPGHLWLGTNADNVSDRVRKGRSKGPRGEAHPKAKLTTVQAIAIRYDPRTPTQIVKSGMYPIGLSSIRSIQTGKNWKHLNSKDYRGGDRTNSG